MNVKSIRLAPQVKEALILLALTSLFLILFGWLPTRAHVRPGQNSLPASLKSDSPVNPPQAISSTAKSRP